MWSKIVNLTILDWELALKKALFSNVLISAFFQCKIEINGVLWYRGKDPHWVAASEEVVSNFHFFLIVKIA